MTRAADGPDYAQTVWSWTEHLRAGGSTPWTAWVASGSGRDARVPPARNAPGAAQLELARRLAEAAPGAFQPRGTRTSAPDPEATQAVQGVEPPARRCSVQDQTACA